MAYATSDIRNLALIGHVGAGKTLLAEALLHQAGVLRAMGELARGTTVCDFDPLEHEMQHSLDCAVCHLESQGRRVNLIDTPGYLDLLGRSQSILSAVETAAIVIDAPSGIEVATRRMSEAAVQRNLDRILVVTKIDQPRTDWRGLLEQLREAFGPECMPINLPAGGGRRVVDCFFSRTGVPTDFSSVEQAHRSIIEQVIEVDTELLERYLGGDEDIGAEQLHAPFERALREGHLIPVCFTSASTGAGVPELLELLERLLPNPLEANPPAFFKGAGVAMEPVQVRADPALHALAHVFKVSVDPYQGRVSQLRVQQGTIRPGMQLFIGDQRKPFKVTHLYQAQGMGLQEIAAAIPGDLCALTKVDDLQVGSVVHDSHEQDHFHLRPASLAASMHGIAIAAARHGDEQKLADSLHKLLSEDPSLRLEHVPSLNETVLYGLGELHLRVALEHMKRQYNISVQTHAPGVPYRETVLRPAAGHHRHKKQTGGAGQYGEVYLRIEPLARGGGFEFVDAVKGGAIPTQYVPAVEKGVRQVLQSGAIAGFPIQDVRVVVYDGKTHPVDSKEVAFITAGRKAFLDAIGKARPIVLEPIVNLGITAPTSTLGSVAGDLRSLRARINNETILPGNQAMISVQVPLAELADFGHRLRGLTSGEGLYTMEFSHYEPALPRLQEQLIASYSRRHGEADEA
jgi:elongation factor G